ncbi:hypothetical protein KC354_g15315 [Hortaea werneckii]|nr:hypothetical protein KC354_g15315 [Hortaea werneckii]
MEDRGPTIVTLLVVFTIISALFIAARLFVRIKLLRNLGADDYLITLAWICAIINTGISARATHWGSGRHFEDLTAAQKSKVIHYNLAAFCPSILSIGIPKLAVVALLTKLLEPTRWHRITMWTAAGLTNLLLFGCVIILYAQCQPARSQWNFSVEGQCWSPWVLVYWAIVSGSISAFMDLYLAVYPATVLWKLQMNMKKKLGLSAALGFGIVATIVAAYKCTKLPGLAGADYSWATSEMLIWTCVEGSTIIIAACIPIMQPLLRLIIHPSVMSTGRQGRRYDIHEINTPQYDLSSDLNKSSKARSRAKVGVSYPTEVNSEESILREEAGSGPDISDHRIPKRFSQSGIRRTDEVEVSSTTHDGTEHGKEQKKEGLMDKMFHHHHKDGQSASKEGESGEQPPQHKETEGEKVKDYMKEERKLDEEGKEYGGLM